MRTVATPVSLGLLLFALSCHGGQVSEPAVAPPAGEEVGSNQPPQAAEVDAAWVPLRPQLGYNARQGKSLFQHYCLPCHGEQGQGDGFNAYNLDPRPRNLSDLDFQNERTDQDLIAVIESGGGAAGLSTGMPPWGRTLNSRQIANLAVYLRTLAQKPEEDTTP